MIYQCYFAKEHEHSLFPLEPYRGFGLEPEVNSRLLENCPELASPFIRKQLTEYACLLWHWRNNDGDSWFGTTSFRQLMKFPHVFQSRNQISELVKDHGIVAWGQYRMVDEVGRPISLKEQTEICHKGLNDFMEECMIACGEEVPKDWSTKDTGFFANYWVMRRDLFESYMEYSWPIVKWALENVKDSDFIKKQAIYGTVHPDKAVGYLMERLFLMWYLKEGITPYNPSVAQVLGHRRA